MEGAPKRTRSVGAQEVRDALDYAAGARSKPPDPALVAYLVREGYVTEERVGVMGMGRKLSLTEDGRRLRT